MIKCSYTEFFIAVLYNAEYNYAQARASYTIQLSNTIHCIHKSSVKLHELDVYSHHIVVIYLPM